MKEWKDRPLCASVPSASALWSGRMKEWKDRPLCVVPSACPLRRSPERVVQARETAMRVAKQCRELAESERTPD